RFSYQLTNRAIWPPGIETFSLNSAHRQHFRFDRSLLGAATAAATATAAASRDRQGKRNQLTGRLSADGHHDELAILIEVGHRQSGLRAGQRNLCKIFPGFLVVRVKQRMSA